MLPALRAPIIKFESTPSRSLCCSSDFCLQSPCSCSQPAWAARPCWGPAGNSELGPPPPRPRIQLTVSKGCQEAKKYQPKYLLPLPLPVLKVKLKVTEGIHSAPRTGFPLPTPGGVGPCCRRHFPGREQCHPQRSGSRGTPNPQTVKLWGQSGQTKRAC